MNETTPLPDWKGRESDPGPEDYYIEAGKSLVEKPLRTIKDNDLFGVFDTQGDFNNGDHNSGEMGPEGLYYMDTRFLSGLRLRLGDKSPLLLGSVVLEDNGAINVDMTNADLHGPGGRLWLPRDSIFLNRLKILHTDTYYERLLLRRFEQPGGPVPLELAFEADFADLFEVRGEQRQRRGTMISEVPDNRTIRFIYQGLDGIERSTSLYFDPPPDRLDSRSAEWDICLEDDVSCAVIVKAVCAVGRKKWTEPFSHLAAFRSNRRSSRRQMARFGGIVSSNELVNEVIRRSASDLDMLLTNTEFGLYPYAGVPWYSTIFGRDGILTAMQLLWIAPEIARGVLIALALSQATGTDDAADAEPGKIVHEMRSGEMARLGEVPFRRYYGSVDATPLFVWLAGEYLKRTGDLETIRGIWPNIEAALGWIDTHGDQDGDGFVEYQRATARGLVNQGWKDSHDSIFHADGRLVEGPVALCEVQAYVFAARKAAAGMAARLGHSELSRRLNEQAETLRRDFEDRFWIEELGLYALALDGRKEPCRVRASNAGHALFAGIASPERAGIVASQLMGANFFSGWGVRTIAAGEARYNPMSYHNGSVWPHDNALIAVGFARYGRKDGAARIFQGLMDAALSFEFRRLPELFCGFTRRRQRGPTPYPVACSPQAWAAAAPYALIAAVTGLKLDHERGFVCLEDPVLPPGLDALYLPELRIGESNLRLQLNRSGNDVTTSVVAREGDAGLVILK